MFYLLLSCLAITAASAHAADAPEPASPGFASWQYGPPTDPDYFPIAVWLQHPRNAGQYKQIGINLYVGLWKGPTEEQLEQLRAADMPVICSQNAVGLAHRNDPIIVGWMHGDEPDNAQPITDPVTGKRSYGGPVPPSHVVEDYQHLRKTDPTRPILLNLGQGVANDEWKGRGSGAHLDDYLTYVQGADIVSFDVYPVVGIRKPDGENYLWYVAKGLTRLREWTRGEKILWNCIECTHISEPDKKATPHQVRAEVWMSLIHGSRGIIWFVHQFKPRFIEAGLLADPEMRQAVSDINHQIHALAPILNSPTLTEGVDVHSSDSAVPIAVMLKRYEGDTYLFTVGMRNGATTGRFRVTGLPENGIAEVLGEEREIPLRSGEFSDHFDPYDVHLYRLR